MEIKVEEIVDKMMTAAEGAFEDGWEAVKTYAPAEFRKMAVQLTEIAENVALYEVDQNKGYSPETGKVLFQMQRTACECVLVATTQLTMIAVQNALNAIMKVLKDAFSGVVSAII